METTEKKKWETPKIEDLSATKTESATYTSVIEVGSYYATTSFPGT